MKPEFAPGACAIAAFLTFLISLSNASSAATREPEYLPLASGIEYIMDVNAVDPGGKKIKGTAYRQIKESVKRGSKVYFKVRTWAEGLWFKADSTELVRKDETGFYSIDDTTPNTTERRKIILPLKVGNTWEFETPAGRVKCSVVAKESITVAGKQYENCFRFKQESDDGTYAEEYWEAPGIGSVRNTLKLAGGTITLTLREFKQPGN